MGRRDADQRAPELRLKAAIAALMRRKRLFATVQVVLLVLLLGFLGYAVRGAWNDAAPRLEHANRVDLLLACLALVAYYLAFVPGWQLILRDLGVRLGYRDALRAEMLSLLAKYVPGGVWTPAARVVAVRRQGVTDTSLVLSSILLEAGLSAIAGVVVLVVSLRTVGSVHAPLWPLALFVVVAAFLLHPRIFVPLATRIFKLFGGGQAPTLRWRVVLLLLCYYCGTWVIGGSALYFLLESIGHVNATAIPFLGGVSAVGAIVAVLVVFAPSGLGVREASTYGLLLAVAPRGVALGAVVLNRIAITVVEVLLLAATALTTRRQRDDDGRDYPAP